MKQYRAIFFDAGFTLFEPDPPFHVVYSQVCGKYGFTGSEEQMRESMIQAWRDAFPPQEMQSPGSTSDEHDRRWWWRYYEALAARLGGLQRPAECFDEIYHYFAMPGAYVLYPDTLEVLGMLGHEGYRLGIVSNWSSSLEDICRGLGIASCFDFIVASAAVGLAKPDVRIFRHALRLAGAGADEALHVGDSYEADVIGARNAGIDAVRVDRSGNNPAEHPTIPSLAGLLSLLRPMDH